MQLNQIGFKASMLTLEPQFVTTPNFGAAVGSADYFLATPVMPFVLYNSFFPAVDSKYQAVFISLASFVSCWVNVLFTIASTLIHLLVLSDIIIYYTVSTRAHKSVCVKDVYKRQPFKAQL